MVICIEEFLQKIPQRTFPVAKVAAQPRQVGKTSDDNGPNDDPPSALRLAA
jgi:hypothetical protein